MRHFTFSFSFCVMTEIAIASLIAVFTAIGQSDFVSFLFAVSFVIALLYAAINYHHLSIPTILLIVLCALNATLNGLVADGHFSFDYYKKVIMFSTFIILLELASVKGQDVSDKVIRWMQVLPFIAGIILIISYYYWGNTETIADGITLGFTNPNFTGMWLLHLFLYGCLFIFRDVKRYKKRLFFIPLLVIIWNLLLDTLARSCIIGGIAFFVLIAFRLFKKKINKPIILALVLFPIVYSLIYLQVVRTDWFLQTFNFWSSEGKALTSRVEIWQTSFDLFLQHPITGNYSGISGGYGFSQLHNTHVDTLASYGIIPFALFIRVLYRAMCEANNLSESFFQYAAFSAFSSIIIMGSFEASVVSGAMGLNLLTIGLLVLACKSESAVPLEEKESEITMKVVGRP